MTGPDLGAATGALVKVVVGKGLPAVGRKIHARVAGREILIVGPGAAGKSTLRNYLAHGVFQHGQEYEMTVDPTRSGALELGYGTSRIQIRDVREVPGQYTAPASKVAKHRPHGLIVMLDLTADMDDVTKPLTSTLPWLRNFLRDLEDKHANMPRRKRRLRSVVVALNKADLAPENYEATRQAVDLLIRDKFPVNAGGPRFRRLQHIHIRRCVLVENPDGRKWVDAVFIDLAKDMNEKKG